ncbi:MAG: hypothetical protein KF691_03240 [Phycisphaeraceae bacterium]|nr:hypothetical protein [Phycisphaeraceae bacterium]
MAGLRPYAIWDYMWVTQQVLLRRKVRAPHPLGRRRSLLERIEILWRSTLWMRAAVLAVSLGGLLASVTVLSRWPLAFVLGAVVSLLGYAMCMFFEAGPVPDGRCIAAAHDRAKFLASEDDASISSELADRRRWWKLRLVYHQRDRHQAMMSASALGRLLSVFMFSLVLFGQLIGPLVSTAAEVFAPRAASSGARPVYRSDAWSMYPIFFMFAVLIAFLAARHFLLKRVRSRLFGSLEGQLCCDCGYEVERGRTFAYEGNSCINLGPERCSECGCPWPLVPPQTMDPAGVCGGSESSN